MFWGFSIIGMIAGIFSGFFGIGGAIIMIPSLTHFYRFSQKTVQGTTLAAMIPPSGLLATMAYWKTGRVNIRASIFIALGFFIGGLLGGIIVQYIPEYLLRKAFAVTLMVFAVRMLII